MNDNTCISSSISGEKYAKLFQLSTNIISLSTVKEGRFLEVNDAFVASLGYSRDEIIGKTAFELGLYANPDDRLKLLQATDSKEQRQNIEIQIRAKDGSIHDALFSGSKISIDNEICWLLSVTDISELKRTENALQKYAARYQHIVEDQSELICRYQADGKLTFVNKAYARYFCKSRAELIDRNYIPNIPKPDLALISRRLAEITRDNPLVDFEHRVILQNGAVRWQHWIHRGIYADDGKILEYQAVGRDITESKQAEQGLVDAAENKFKTIFDHATDGILVADVETKKFAMANQTICRMLGYSSEEISHLGIMDIHPEKDIAYVIDQFEQQAKGLISLAKDMPVIRKNGSIFYVDINSAIITIAGKQYITRFFRDITERKQTEAELVRAHKQLQHLLDAASQISIIHTDLAGTILTFTRGAERMLGYSAAEMIGKQTPAIIHLASEMAARGQELTRELGYPVEGFEVFVAYAKQGKHDEREWTYVRKDGKYIIVDLIVTAVRDEFDNITGFLGIANDITERKLVIEAQAANSAKSQFVANISHEIRTPLNGIIGICELLLETKLSGEQLEYARIIDSSAENLLNIVNATLDFSKIEAGKMVLENIDFNLREIIEDTIGILSINASKKKLELTDFIESEVPIYLHGDPSRLRQILVNLVGNAIKFTFKGDISLKVALLEENHARATLRFSVQDTGIGIPADKTAAIFNSFTQADVSLARRFGGTGLGLSIAKGLTEQMGGKIGVDSDYGKGSIFWFVVPFAKQQHPTPAFLPHANLGEAKILVVDDNAANRMLLVQQLRAWHISIATAAGGAEALATMRSAAQKKHPFAAAIIDLCMPEMDGIRLAQAIKADSALKRTILLLMSAMLQLPATYSQYKHLFAAMIVKPIRQAYLLHSLLTSLKGTKMSVIEKKWWAEFQRHQQFNVGNRLHILVAEDNIANQQVILSILERMGHVANAVANGHETVTALETVAYDLVLMDIQMPEMDGIQATALIRDPASKVIDHGIPILALTAHAMEGDREKCLTAGMNGYITKPVSIKAIADAIAKIAITTKIFSSRDKKQRSTQAGGRPAANRIRSNTANAIIKESPRRDKAASEPHPSPATAVFDSKAFADRLRGNRASMLKIINIILKETPKLARQFERSVKSCAQEPAARLAHNIKGSAANIGGNQLFAVAAQIETACNLGDWTGAKHLLPELRRTLSGLERALRHFKTKLSIAKEESHENSRRR